MLTIKDIYNLMDNGYISDKRFHVNRTNNVIYHTPKDSDSKVRKPLRIHPNNTTYDEIVDIAQENYLYINIVSYVKFNAAFVRFNNHLPMTKTYTINEVIAERHLRQITTKHPCLLLFEFDNERCFEILDNHDIEYFNLQTGFGDIWCISPNELFTSNIKNKLKLVGVTDFAPMVFSVQPSMINHFKWYLGYIMQHYPEFGNYSFIRT